MGVFYCVLLCLCRDSLQEVVRVVGSVSDRVLGISAVLHGEAKLRLHHLLQHAALQRPAAQEESAVPRVCTAHARSRRAAARLHPAVPLDLRALTLSQTLT